VKRPLFKPRWTGAIDTTGGTILAGLVKAAAYGAAVTSCGLTQSGDLPLSVFPFILRGVQLLGVDSVENPIGERRRIWERIATDLRQPKIEEEAHEIALADVPRAAATLLDGTHSGRTVVRVSGE
jgi:alcohol dehydrogenase